MARTRCTCGNQVLWKADEQRSDEWLLAARPDLPDEISHLTFVRTPGAAFCRECGRFWVVWDEGAAPAEYVPTDPGVRPVRRPLT